MLITINYLCAEGTNSANLRDLDFGSYLSSKTRAVPVYRPFVGLELFYIYPKHLKLTIMGARPVKMTVNNYTSIVLVYKTKKLDHGKFTTDPPSTIESTGSWACSAQDGIMIGAEGTVTYAAQDNSFTVEFHFNHPYGSAESSYSVTTNPPDAISAKINGPFTGHNQDITFELYAV